MHRTAGTLRVFKGFHSKPLDAFFVIYHNNLQFFSLNNTVKRFDIKFLTKLSIFCHF